jgi:hypothetical protein
MPLDSPDQRAAQLATPIAGRRSALGLSSEHNGAALHRVSMSLHTTDHCDARAAQPRGTRRRWTASARPRRPRRPGRARAWRPRWPRWRSASRPSPTCRRRRRVPPPLPSIGLGHYPTQHAPTCRSAGQLRIAGMITDQLQQGCGGHTRRACQLTGSSSFPCELCLVF